jgi:hypothetical protein
LGTGIGEVVIYEKKTHEDIKEGQLSSWFHRDLGIKCLENNDDDDE